MSHTKTPLCLIVSICALILVFRCELPQDPDDPSNAKVILLLRNSRWEQSNLSISDTVGNTIQIGLAIHLPFCMDSIRLSIQSETDTLFDTTIRTFNPGRDVVCKVDGKSIHGNLQFPRRKQCAVEDRELWRLCIAA